MWTLTLDMFDLIASEASLYWLLAWSLGHLCAWLTLLLVVNLALPKVFSMIALLGVPTFPGSCQYQ